MTTNEDTRKAQECAAAFKPLAEMGGAKPDARAAALAAGFTIDDSTYPPIAYKGSRFQPTEWHNVPSETEATLSAQLATAQDLHRRANERVNVLSDAEQALVKDLAAMREVLEEVCKAADQTLWPNAISADELALIGMMSASSEKSVDRVREMAETLRTAQTNLKAALARAAALGVKP